MTLPPWVCSTMMVWVMGFTTVTFPGLPVLVAVAGKRKVSAGRRSRSRRNSPLVVAVAFTEVVFCVVETLAVFEALMVVEAFTEVVTERKKVSLLLETRRSVRRCLPLVVALTEVVQEVETLVVAEDLTEVVTGEREQGQSPAAFDVDSRSSPFLVVDAALVEVVTAFLDEEEAF